MLRSRAGTARHHSPLPRRHVTRAGSHPPQQLDQRGTKQSLSATVSIKGWQLESVFPNVMPSWATHLHLPVLLFQHCPFFTVNITLNTNRTCDTVQVKKQGASVPTWTTTSEPPLPTPVPPPSLPLPDKAFFSVLNYYMHIAPLFFFLPHMCVSEQHMFYSFSSFWSLYTDSYSIYSAVTFFSTQFWQSHTRVHRHRLDACSLFFTAV